MNECIYEYALICMNTLLFYTKSFQVSDWNEIITSYISVWTWLNGS